MDTQTHIMAKKGYELSDAHINDIIKRTFPVSSVPILPLSVLNFSPAAAPAPAPPPPPPPPTATADPAIASERKMVKRISTIYQQMQPKSSIYKKYGGDSDDDGDAESGNIDAGACIMKLSKSLLETPVLTTSKSKSNYKLFPVPKMPGTGMMHNNQLLWCVYIAINGRVAFDTMHNAFVTETEFKYATVEMMRIQKMRIKTLFKRYKLSMPNFEAELISSKKLDISGMMALALCHEQNILYIDNRMYYEIIATDAADSMQMTVIEKIRNRYCVHDNNAAASGTLQMCRDTLWKMESITAPIKSVSHYKLSELQDIYARLGCGNVDSDSKKRVTKPELYAAIMSNIA